METAGEGIRDPGTKAHRDAKITIDQEGTITGERNPDGIGTAKKRIVITIPSDGMDPDRRSRVHPSERRKTPSGSPRGRPWSCKKRPMLR